MGNTIPYHRFSVYNQKESSLVLNILKYNYYVANNDDSDLKYLKELLPLKTLIIRSHVLLPSRWYSFFNGKVDTLIVHNYKREHGSQHLLSEINPRRLIITGDEQKSLWTFHLLPRLEEIDITSWDWGDINELFLLLGDTQIKSVTGLPIGWYTMHVYPISVRELVSIQFIKERNKAPYILWVLQQIVPRDVAKLIFKAWATG